MWILFTSWQAFGKLHSPSFVFRRKFLYQKFYAWNPRNLQHQFPLKLIPTVLKSLQRTWSIMWEKMWSTLQAPHQTTAFSPAVLVQTWPGCGRWPFSMPSCLSFPRAPLLVQEPVYIVSPAALLCYGVHPGVSVTSLLLSPMRQWGKTPCAGISMWDNTESLKRSC